MLATLAASDAAVSGMFDSSFALCANGRALEEIRAAGGRVESLGDVRLSRPTTVWEARARLRQFIQHGRPDIVICHAPWAYALFAYTARRGGARLVWWQHDAATGRTWIERWARGTRADLVVSNSRWTAQSASAIQPGVPLEVIYCPVPAPPPVTAQKRDALRAALSTPASDLVVLCAARLEPWKGQLGLIRAFSRLQDPPGHTTLWIAGGAQRPHEVKYLRTLRREAEAHGVADQIRWLGERRDVPCLMASADIFCQPNLTAEPFGIAFAEALRSGIPVVTSDMGGAPEIVDSQCGRLVPPNDDAALVSALRDLLGDAVLRRSLGSAGPAHAASRCDPSTVLPRLAAALAGLTTKVAA